MIMRLAVNLTYTSHDCQSFCGQKSWVADLFVDDAVKYFLLIITGKWRLKSQNTKQILQNNTLQLIHK